MSKKYAMKFPRLLLFPALLLSSVMIRAQEAQLPSFGYLKASVLAWAQENLSPTDTLKAYIAAASEKDAAGMKSHLSAGTLKVMEESAKAQNKNLDDMLREEAGQKPPEDNGYKYSNEKIDGDNATVDMTVQGQTVTMPLVKENGEWKIAIDKFVEDMKTKLGDKP